MITKKGVAFVFKNGLVLRDVDGVARTHRQGKNAIASHDVQIVTRIDQVAMWKQFFKVLQNP